MRFLLLAVIVTAFISVNCSSPLQRRSAKPAASATTPALEVIALGTGGGVEEDNLTAYLLGERGRGAYVLLDAGTVLAGLSKASQKGSFDHLRLPAKTKLTTEHYIMRHAVRAVFLSHAHLDHVSGLAIYAPGDTKKPIYGRAATIDTLRDHLFNWKIWPNFGSEGQTPLGLYQYRRLPLGQPQKVKNTRFKATAFPLSHSRGFPSTAFLLEAKSAAILFIGDTGPDEVEGGDHLARVWKAVAKRVSDGHLRAIFIECSYPDGRSREKLYGHLTPKWIRQELGALNTAVRRVGGRGVKGLSVIITHVKPSVRRGENTRTLIGKQLNQHNDLGVRFLQLAQGARAEL